jgi:hypothetical protein
MKNREESAIPAAKQMYHKSHLMLHKLSEEENPKSLQTHYIVSSLVLNESLTSKGPY